MPTSLMRRVLAFAPGLVLAVLMVPIITGLIGTWLPSLGILPVIGAVTAGLDPWRDLLDYPGVHHALLKSLVSAWGACLVAVLLTLSLLSFTYRSRSFGILRGGLPGLLAVPHAAFAIALVALFSPSGWIMKLLSPWLTGYDFPPTWSLVQDPHAVSLMVILGLKETPFLLFMALAGLDQLPVKQSLRQARSLGYTEFTAWWRVVVPQLLPMLRLPVFAILAFGLAVVDMALIAGPTAPPTLAVVVDGWFNHPDISERLRGSAGATLLLVMTGFSLSLWYLIEKLWIQRVERIIATAPKTSRARLGGKLIAGSGWVLLSVYVAGAVVLLLWSLAFRWGFPDLLPESYSLRFWEQGLLKLTRVLWVTLATGFATAATGLMLAVMCLENEVTQGRQIPGYQGPRGLWLIYLPLLVPQIAFLFGVQMLLVWLQLDGSWITLFWAHLMFVVPYVFLSLSGPYRQFDDRYLRQASLLCGSELRGLLTVKLAMLARPLCYAFAVGFAVSVAQYLVTLYVGAGRFATVTTETVAVIQGGDRRTIAVHAVVQLFLPMSMFVIAILVPAWFRSRSLMKLSFK